MMPRDDTSCATGVAAPPVNKDAMRDDARALRWHFRVRPLLPSDYRVVQTICCDNAFLGDPIDPIFCDRELFSAMFVDPYLEHASEWAFVAESGGQVIGYLTGALDARFLRTQTLRCCGVTRDMAVRMIAGTYCRNPRSHRFLQWLLTRAAFERVRRPPFSAHMHFNVMRQYRGASVGHALWHAFETKLVAAGENRYFGEVLTSRPRSVTKVYSRFGLSVYDVQRSTIFAPERDDVWSICFLKGSQASGDADT